MITEKLRELAADEAAKLKAAATPAELERLDLSVLEPRSPSHCIYGQIAGHCFSLRATELLNACAEPLAALNGMPFREWAKHPTRRKRFPDRDRQYFSPIEVYIAQDGAEIANLVNYLKGDTDILEI